MVAVWCEADVDFAVTDAWLQERITLLQVLRVPLEAAKQEFEAIISEKFAQQGPGWAALRPLTVAKRSATGPILHESGDMEASFKDGGPDHIERWSDVEVETGSNMIRAAAHESGFANRGTFPGVEGLVPPIKFHGKQVTARPVLGLWNSGFDARITDRFIESLEAYLGL